MPRLPPKLLRQARNIHPLLPLVLRGIRDIASAKNELRWLEEHVLEQNRSVDRVWRHNKLHHLCVERSRGKPLQYLIGTEFFGNLEILCEPGVLIPRQETAASVTYLVQRLQRQKSLPKHLRVLDLCTGTGCIPLLLHDEFCTRHGRQHGLEVIGVDISSRAINLARRNKRRLFQDGTLQFDEASHTSLQFLEADILADETCFPENTKTLPLMTELQSYEDSLSNKTSSDKKKLHWNILISNPPYISPKEFNRTTSRSVKNFEPKLALVPGKRYVRPGIDPGDVFYPRLLEISEKVDAQVVLFEVADLDQASRVASMMQRQNIWCGIEIWRDDPTYSDGDTNDVVSIPSNVKVLGSGNGRSVFAWRGDADAWLGQKSSS